MSKIVDKSVEVATNKYAVWGTIATIILGTGGFTGYRTARDFIINPLKTRIDTVISQMTISNRQSAHEEMDIEVLTRLMFNKNKVDSVRNIIIEEKAKDKFCKESPGLCL